MLPFDYTTFADLSAGMNLLPVPEYLRHFLLKLPSRKKDGFNSLVGTTTGLALLGFATFVTVLNPLRTVIAIAAIESLAVSFMY